MEEEGLKFFERDLFTVLEAAGVEGETGGVEEGLGEKFLLLAEFGFGLGGRGRGGGELSFLCGRGEGGGAGGHCWGWGWGWG